MSSGPINKRRVCGGEGHVGTVVDAQSATTDREGESEARAVIVTVRWDRGNRCRYLWYMAIVVMCNTLCSQYDARFTQPSTFT